jgi:release factor glutamine methyltransferase
MGDTVWTVRAALEWTEGFLGEKGIEAPRRSAEWLISAATGLSRVELYTAFDRPLSPEERAALRELVKARASGMPLQYVTGEVAFRRVILKVRPGVFIPRPETEVLVDAVLEYLSDRREPLVVDVCTGSACVAISVAHEHPDARVIAVELVEDTAAAAAENRARLGLSDRVEIVQGDLFAPLPPGIAGSVDVVVSNPPYIPSADLPDLPGEVLGFEPHVALDGGPDGLDVARRIMEGAGELLAPGGLVALELDEGRVAAFAAEIEAMPRFVDVVVRRDLAGRDRIVTARRAQGG